MKKNHTKKAQLLVSTEKIRELGTDQLTSINGGQKCTHSCTDYTTRTPTTTI